MHAYQLKYTNRKKMLFIFSQIKGKHIMKVGIYFTGTGPILILTTYDSLDDPEIIKKLSAKGIKKFIAYEVPEKRVKELYSTYYAMILGDLRPEDDFRVLDYDGHNVFYNFAFDDFSEPIFYEPLPVVPELGEPP
jgi:hypothetical protein